MGAFRDSKFGLRGWWFCKCFSPKEGTIPKVETSPIITVGTFVSAFVGALFGVIIKRIESRPLLRIQVGLYCNIKGQGRNLTVTNVGLEPVPEYQIELYHPQRGSLMVFGDASSERVFPQYPEQKNVFKCLSRPK